MSRSGAPTSNFDELDPISEPALPVDSAAVQLGEVSSNPLAPWRFVSSSADAAFSARPQFAHYLRERGTADSDFHAAKTIFGELVCNVVRHAPGPISIQLDWTNDRCARLRVEDTGPPFQCAPVLPGDVFSEGGRGLFIVKSLAADLKISRNHKGSIVTAILPVRAAV